MIVEILVGGLLIGGVVTIGQVILDERDRKNEEKLKKIPVKKK